MKRKRDLDEFSLAAVARELKVSRQCIHHKVMVKCQNPYITYPLQEVRGRKRGSKMIVVKVVTRQEVQSKTIHECTCPHCQKVNRLTRPRNDRLKLCSGCQKYFRLKVG